MPMKPIPSRIYDFLRSRRLAIALLVALAAWAGLSTLVPQGGTPDSLPGGFAAALVAAVGLDRAFSAPVFLLLCALLFASTVACSVERTRAALKLARRAALLANGTDAIAATRTDFVLSTDLERRAVLERISQAFERAGLRARAVSDSAVYATSSRLGLAGSPAFHWLLALLIALIAAGQLTRAEGLMGVPVGSARIDARESYGVVSEGPLHSRFTSLVIAVPSIALSHVVDGIERGPAPYVELRDGPYLLRAGYVYPNRPLRYKSLVIHANEHGLAIPVVAQDGSSVDVLLDFDEESCAAQSVSALEASGPGGPTRITFEVPLDTYRGQCVTAVPRDPRVAWRATGPSGETSGAVRPGESFEPAPGVALSLGALGYYARLSVVDDWSVYPIYAVFALATLALAISVFLPYREAVAVIEGSDHGCQVGVRVRHARRDPGFGARVRKRVEEIVLGAVEADRRSGDDD